MPRLDVWLVETEKFSSRQAAKRAIKDGLVTVNGETCKPSKQVSEKDIIKVLSDDADFPLGYKKLSEIDERLGGDMVCQPCLALDIGSSAGGFLLYLANKGANAVGIEVSERFAEDLHRITEEHSQISVLIEDAFDIDPTVVATPSTLDLLLVDVTTSPEGTLKLIERFTPLLREKGRMLAAFKCAHDDEGTIEMVKNTIFQMGYERILEICLDETRQEVHVAAVHM